MNVSLLHEYPSNRNRVQAEKYIYIQPKLDGWRAYIDTHTGLIYSRSGNEIVLPHITDSILSMHGLPEYLDGELYVHKSNADQVHSMIARKDEDLRFNCFDCMTTGNFTYRLRKVMAIKESVCVRTVATYKISPADIDRYYAEYLRMGLEGAVIRFDTRYREGRTEDVLKIKPIYDGL